jgi:hypothetical protein
MTYYRVCHYSNTTCATSGAGTAYPPGAHAFTPVFSWVRVSSIWVQLKSHLRGIGPLRMTESDASHMTGSDVSHVTGSDVSHCPEVCSAHAQPEVAPYPP